MGDFFARALGGENIMKQLKIEIVIMGSDLFSALINNSDPVFTGVAL